MQHQITQNQIGRDGQNNEFTIFHEILTDQYVVFSSTVNHPLGQPQEAHSRPTVQETGTFQSTTGVISCVKSSLLFLHSSGCISSHFRGCCSSTGRGRNQLLLDVWAERAVGHFQHASGSAVGTRGAAEIPRPGTLGSTAAVRGHGLDTISQGAGRQK